MKTLEEFFSEVIEDIFPSFSEEHKNHLNLMFRHKTVEFLKQFRENTVDDGQIQWNEDLDQIISSVQKDAEK